jgi:hypothetical protein
MLPLPGLQLQLLLIESVLEGGNSLFKRDFRGSESFFVAFSCFLFVNEVGGEELDIGVGTKETVLFFSRVCISAWVL